jgi:mannose-6-phosphate isomerase-like protein (cupin superfamily)
VSYSKDLGEVNALYRPVDEVATLTLADTFVRFTAPGSATNDQYGLFEWNMSAASGGSSPHFHKIASEAFYVMEGTVRFFNGESSVDATKGDFLYVPQGGIHSFANESGAPARMIVLSRPASPVRITFTNSPRSARRAAP